MKNMKFSTLIILLIFIMIGSVGNDESDKEKDTDKVDSSVVVSETKEEFPIKDYWVYRYNTETEKAELAQCGYADEYTSIVIDTDETLKEVITGSYMYLGNIKGYQREDKTMDVYQVKLPELDKNFVLTNDAFEIDYSGNSEMVEVYGWVYLDGTTILAVAPLYKE